LPYRSILSHQTKTGSRYAVAIQFENMAQYSPQPEIEI